ncbi:MAG: RnfABCDGE type electron transport complex subunit C, partial [Clostridia bacterium]|nr:RnfABCDGE type electron transport complex subunit C [Clostridia bacterium]
MDTLFFPKKPFPHRGGIRIPHRKNTAEKETVRMPAPAEVAIPMQMHIGAPCTPTVAVGDRVLVGQKIGDSAKSMSSPIYASVSGTVKSISQIPLGGGAYGEAVVIASDGLMEEASFSPVSVTNAQGLAAAARNGGLVVLGGAGFPAHIKLTVPEGKTVDTLLINVAECEPYLTADYREVLENSWDVMSGIFTVKSALNIHRVLICVEDNKPEAVRTLREIADNSADAKDEVRVLSLPASYPHGAEKVLIKAATGREVPAGKLPADAGCIVMNVTSIATLARFIKTGKPLTEKRLTVDGAIACPQNVMVPIGTYADDVLSFCGGFTEEPKKVLFGGPMMGFAQKDLHIPVVKNSNGILVLGEKEAKLSDPTPCIRCGSCLSVCPMGL